MAKGGKRQGAGRPLGSGKYGESTKAIRIPLSEVENVMDFIERKSYRLPFFEHAVAAGFPSPAEDSESQTMDLNEYLIKHPTSTFFVKVAGSSMINAGIHHNDVLVVDRSLEPLNGKIIVAAVNGELTVKRLSRERNRVRLLPENEAFTPIDIDSETQLHIWGVVTSVIHSV